MQLAHLMINGKAKPCLLNNNQYVDLQSLMQTNAQHGLNFKQAIEMLSIPEIWQDVCKRAQQFKWHSIHDKAVSFLPPLAQQSRVFCVGKNYRDHMAEMGTTYGDDVKPNDVPNIFTRFASSFTGHQCLIEYPKGETTYDYEGELAVVIGKSGRGILLDHALDHVFGYTAANDGSVRRIQKRTTQFTMGKNIDASGALGPAIRHAHMCPDILSAKIQTFVNDECRQDGQTNQMIHSLPFIIHFLSSMTSLQAGDIILTGTPAGVGAGFTPPKFLQKGDSVSVKISGLLPLEMQVSESMHLQI